MNPQAFQQGFNKENLKQTREYLNNKFEEIFKETGIRFSIGNITFENESFRTTMEAKLNITSQVDKDKQEWDMYCTMFGFEREDFGREFESQGQTYMICGIKKYAETKPVVACLKSDPSKKYIFHKDLRKKLHPGKFNY